MKHPQFSEIHAAIGLAALLALADPAGAQNAPLQSAPSRNAPASSASSPAPSSQATVIDAPAATATFRLNAIRFSPTRAVPMSALQDQAKQFLHQDITTTDLAMLAAAIRRVYDERGLGFVGVAYPGQDLTRGVLKVDIVEPGIERVAIESDKKPPVSPQRIAAVLANAGVKNGQPLDMQSLDRAMFTLNDWPGVSAKATLLPTGDEGRYSVSVQTEPRRAWDGSVEADNHGSSVSGRYRVGALLRWNNPAGIGDNLDLRAMVSNGAGTTVGRLGYELPLGATPWRAGLGYSRVGYELGEQFAGLNAVGSADVLDASLSYPWLRSREANVVVRLGVANKKLSDDFTGTKKTIRAADLGLSFESRSEWLGGGYSGGSASAQFGQLNDRTDAASGGLPADATTLGSFSKVNAQVSRLQSITRGLSFYLGLAVQWASKNLDTAEKFTLGGDKGVRAYPAAEGASDEGMLLNAELRWWITPRWSTYVFHDIGHGKLRKQPDALTGDNSRTLQGTGLGLQFTDAQLFTLKASVARRGDEPVLSENGQSRMRLLLQVQRAF